MSWIISQSLLKTAVVALVKSFCKLGLSQKWWHLTMQLINDQSNDRFVAVSRFPQRNVLFPFKFAVSPLDGQIQTENRLLQVVILQWFFYHCWGVLSSPAGLPHLEYGWKIRSFLNGHEPHCYPEAISSFKPSQPSFPHEDILCTLRDWSNTRKCEELRRLSCSRFPVLYPLEDSYNAETNASNLLLKWTRITISSSSWPSTRPLSFSAMMESHAWRFFGHSTEARLPPSVSRKS